MKIGISIYLDHNETLLSNHTYQHILFLAMALKKLHHEVLLVNGNLNANDLPKDWPIDFRFPVVYPGNAIKNLDRLIIMGSTLPEQCLSQQKQIIFFDIAQHPFRLMESAIYGLLESFLDKMPFTSAWVMPGDKHSSMLQAMTGVAVRTAPFLWSPIVLQASIREASRFGFLPHRNPAWRIAIFEPSIFEKNAYLPLLIADGAYRIRPESIELVVAFNTFHWRAHPIFYPFASHLNVTQDHKATYEKNMDFADGASRFRIDAIVSHQLASVPCIGHYEALYGNYPLIHNAAFLKEAGFYYPDFQAKQGIQRLLTAFQHRDDREYWLDYTRRNQAALAQVHPYAPHNQAALTRLLEAHDDR